MFTYPWFCDWSVVTGIAVKAVLSNGPQASGAPKNGFWQHKPHFGGILQFCMSDSDWELTVHCQIHWSKELRRSPLTPLTHGPRQSGGPRAPSTLRRLWVLCCSAQTELISVSVWTHTWRTNIDEYNNCGRRLLEMVVCRSNVDVSCLSVCCV